MRVIYIKNPSRAHKLVPLLSVAEVAEVRSLKEALVLPRVTEKNSVVMIDSYGRYAMIGMLTSLFMSVPLVVRLRGEYFREQQERAQSQESQAKRLKNLFSQLLAKISLARASMLIFNSQYLADAMSSYCKGKHVAIVHNPYTELPGNDSREGAGSLPHGKLHVLSVARMDLASKVRPTVQALESWIPRAWWEEHDVYWLICGAGVYEGELRSAIRQNDLGERVRMLGMIEGLRRFYEWSDVLVHLTRMDAFPNVTLEAMMHRKPVVTNVDSCGTREQVVDGRNGFVVSDGISFRNALESYLKDRGIRETQGETGEMLVKTTFSVEEQAKRMEAALSALVSDGSVPER
jgi:glycosyltransferase involved in cell wall biosynthesis